jgi:methanogenic corrinoid protein MtbC1
MVPETVYLHYLDALLSGDKNQCTLIVTNLLNKNASIKEIYMDLFQRSMYRIGQMWERKKCSIADEHIATNITQSLIEFVRANSIATNNSSRLALITCLDKEHHELGARMVSGYLEANGWQTIFIGSNVPQNTIIETIRDKKPDLIGISSSFYINLIRIYKLIQAIKEDFYDLEIIVGGQAFRLEGGEGVSGYHKVKYITCLNGLEIYLQKYHNN